MLEIRSFCNSDVPRLAMLWVIHHTVYRPAPLVTPAIWEQAIASRHFFAPQRLLVATWNGEPVAWCQWFIGDSRTAHLAAICFDTSPPAEQAAISLLDECQQHAATAGMTTMVAGISKDSRFGYQGLDPIGQGIGVDVADDRVNQLLEQAGFEEQQRLDRWEVATEAYRPPVNRESLNLRRSTRLELIAPPATTPAESSAMYHFDIHRYQLLPLRGGTPLAMADLWISDPEIHVMSIHQAILGAVASDMEEPVAREAALRHLIASLIPLLAQQHVLALHRSVLAGNREEEARLSALQFRRTGAGRLMSKRLDSQLP
jgi:hypothetical protein